MELELEPEGTFDQRIQWAKETAANYEQWAAKETDPGLRAVQERRAAAWNKTVLDLIAQRAAASAQLDLFRPVP